MSTVTNFQNTCRIEQDLILIQNRQYINLSHIFISVFVVLRVQVFLQVFEMLFAFAGPDNSNIYEGLRSIREQPFKMTYDISFRGQFQYQYLDSKLPLKGQTFNYTNNPVQITCSSHEKIKIHA